MQMQGRAGINIGISLFLSISSGVSRRSVRKRVGRLLVWFSRGAAGAVFEVFGPLFFFESFLIRK
jgi:hypothetical protein